MCKQKTAYEMRISDWSSDVCSSDLLRPCRHADRTRPGVLYATVWRSAGNAGRCSCAWRSTFGRIAMIACIKSAWRVAAIRDCNLARASGVRRIGSRQNAADQRARVIAQSLRRQSAQHRSEGHTSELQSLMRISYAVFCLKKKNKKTKLHTNQ